MVRVEVYGKDDCPLCDEAKDVLRKVQRDLPFDLVEVDIAKDPALLERHRNDVPVVFVDGNKAFKHRLEEAAVRRRIDRAVALAEASGQGTAAAAGSTGAAAQPPPPPRRGLRIAVAAAVVLAVAGVIAASLTGRGERPPPDEQAFQIERVDLPAPDFRVQTRDGKPLSLKDLQGQVVFVNFWATWCPPCRDEMPSMLALGQKLQAEHPGRFRMVAVSVDDGWTPINEFFPDGLPAEVLVGLDQDQATTKAYYCMARGGCPDSFRFPETYVVDQRGRLVAYVVGPRDWSEPAARRFLERLIKS
jgi:thiol-disulfide isomerase/thioredoxin